MSLTHHDNTGYSFSFIYLHFQQDLHKRDPDIYPSPEICPMLEFEWDLYIEQQKKVPFLYIVSF